MFSLTTVINIAVTMVMYADMMLLPLYLQNARGYTRSGVRNSDAPWCASDGTYDASDRKAVRSVWSEVAVHYRYGYYDRDHNRLR